MTNPPEPEGTRRGIWSRFFKGRRPDPLVGPWVSSIVFAGLIYYAERTLPALHDVIVPVYWLLLGIVIFTTARWIRSRRRDRRDGDRRRNDRRRDTLD